MWTVTLTAAKLLGPTPLSATGNYGNKRSAHAHTVCYQLSPACSHTVHQWWPFPPVSPQSRPEAQCDLWPWHLQH